LIELIVAFPRFNFEFAIRFHDPPSGHCDLANIAGLPMLQATPELSPVGSPPDATAEEGVCTTAGQNIENTTCRIFLCKESQEREIFP
jgi:hypothetical protein